MADDAPTLLSKRAQKTTRKRNPSAPTRSGAWRPDRPFKARDGLKVTLRRVRGMTPDGYLEVPFRFQTPPLDTYSDEGVTDYGTFQTLRLGERPEGGGEQLQRPAFDTLFSLDQFNWQVWQGNFNVRRMIDELHALRRNRVPLQLVVAQPAMFGNRPQTDGVFKITRVRAEDRGGEPGTQYVSLEFIQWPPEDLKLRRRSSESDRARRHDLKDTDTLHFIAMIAYHRKSLWQGIARANGIPRSGPGAVHPDSAADLKAWAKKHKRDTLKLPALVQTGRVVGEDRKQNRRAAEAFSRATRR